MKQGALSDHFVGVGTKVLRGTEVDPQVSHGHELQGITRFRKFLGENAQNDVLPVTYVWLSDEEPPVSLPLSATWYDSRRNDPNRPAEYRFYYPAEAEEVVYRARAGDTLILCQPVSGPLLALFCPRDSSIEQQLLWLFGLQHPEGNLLRARDLRDDCSETVGYIARQILEFIGVEVIATEESLLELMLACFGEAFPPTRELSAFTWEHIEGVDGRDDPDGAIMALMDMEERLFMTLERHIVGKRLENGFMSACKPDVDEFVRFSLSVQNRRKSRAGWAFGNHVEAILKLHDVRFCREATTEKRAGPDFLFPGEAEYHDPAWPDLQLTMLAAKTSCKDRWRQVLAEANRIRNKHLLTLEPGISIAQTDEMRRENLQLVLPAGLHATYRPEQQAQLMGFGAFIELVRERQL